MAGIKISDLPPVVTPALSDVAPIDQGAVTYKESNSQLLDLFQANASGTWGISITGNAATVTTNANLTGDVTSVGNTTSYANNVPLAKGGLNASLTASNGGIFYSTATAGAILSGTATAGQILRSGATAAPTWSTATYPATAGTSGNILTSDGANWNSASPAGIGSPLTTKGDLYTFSTVNARLAVGSTNGQILQVSSGAATGLAWSTPTYPSASGTAGKVLASDGTNIVYSTATFPVVGGAAGNILISDGTNYVASTSLWPNTVGSSGKVVISNGTSNVYSTPTFPNTSATSGKLIQSDGTNWVASTATWPTAATSGKFVIGNGTNYVESTSTIPSSAGATANKILLSDGTNYVLSTPTFPNASATSGKIIISDGTNWIASTPTYPAAAGTSGNVLTSDGTNWTSAANAASSPLTTKGDIYAYSTTNGRFPVATGDGKILQVSSGATFGIAYSTPTYPSASGSAGQILRSDGTNNVYTTSTFADTYAVSTLLYASSANVVAGLATVNSAGLLTSSGGVPGWVAYTGTGAPVLGTSPTITTPNIVGTSTNNNAAAGSVGEFVESTVNIGSAVSVTTLTAKTITSISLTAGDWDVYGMVGASAAASTTITQIIGDINTVNNTLSTDETHYFIQYPFNAVAEQPQVTCPYQRISLSGTTTIYLVVRVAFATSTCTAFGRISARRAR